MLLLWGVFTRPCCDVEWTGWADDLLARALRGTMVFRFAPRRLRAEVFGPIMLEPACSERHDTMKPLTLAEAAEFLRMSRSSLYQRKDIPRYRRPGSRVMLFDQNELEAWLKQGRMGGSIDGPVTPPEPLSLQPNTERARESVDIQTGRVYHRNARYR